MGLDKYESKYFQSVNLTSIDKTTNKQIQNFQTSLFSGLGGVLYFE